MIFFFVDTYGLFGAEIELWCEYCYLEELFFKAHNLFGVCPTGISSFGETNDGLCAHFLLWLWHSFYSLFWTRLCCQCIFSIYIHCLPCLSSCIILKCFKEMYYMQKDYNIMLYGVSRFFFLLVLDPNRMFYIKCWNLIMSSSMNSVWCFWMKLLVHNFGFLIFLLLN